MADQTTAFLQALTELADPASYLEVRFRRTTGMGQLFFAVNETDDAARVIAGLGARTDVYIGVLPRSIAVGDRRAVADATVAWVDCDTTTSVGRLHDFRPAPSIVVASGSAGARHAYWLLDKPIGPAAVESLNRRLAVALGSDIRCTDAARVLRPPGTLNHKDQPARSVELHTLSDRRIAARSLVAMLPSVPTGSARAPGANVGPAADALMAIDPPRYVRALAGVQVGRGRKITCPFHEDRTPSLHVYDDPARGWHCYGCGRGGSIYDFAANLWHLETRGADFVTLRARLKEALRV